LGISPDSVASHAKFCEKHKLNFTLLADIDHKIADKYEVWVEKSMYGKKYMGVERDSFLINKEGIVVRQYEKVKPEEHPDEIIIDIKSLKLTK
jgi:peroxiredoxin Q/BCP